MDLTVFLVVGGLGIVLLLLMIFVSDHLHGVFDALGGGEWFTGAGLAAFLGAFGFIGAITLSASGSLVWAVLAGIVSGVLIGVGVSWLTMRLRRQDHGGAELRSAGLVGLIGTVISDIPTGGLGEISVVAGGQLTKLHARAADPLRCGTEVSITDVLSPTAVKVRPTYR